eukprot:2198322-Prymnesium_polylepis.1
MGHRRRHGRARRRRCAPRDVAHALCYHHCRLFGHDPYPWLCDPRAANASGASQYSEAFAALASIVRSHGGDDDAITRRLQSIGAWAPQTDYYAQVARRPGVATICEVGFNAGHSAVVLLGANPSARLEAFDLFSQPHSADCLDYVSRRFPGRVAPHRGPSQRTVPTASLRAPCDLVIVDGRHEFEAVLEDLANLQRHAAPGALYLFDDVCKVTGCENWMEGSAVHMGGPTLAICEAQRAGLLTIVESSFGG